MAQESYSVQLTIAKEMEEDIRVIEHDFETFKEAETFYTQLHDGIVYQGGIKFITELINYSDNSADVILRDIV